MYELNIHVATLDNNHSVTDSTQSVAASIQKFPDSVVKSAQLAMDSRCITMRLSISLRLAVDFFRVIEFKNKCWYLIFTFCGQVDILQ